MKIYNMDALEFLRKMPDILKVPQVKCLFADIPDNLKLKYLGYSDNMKPEDYYNWVRLLVLEALPRCKVLWLCYNALHDLEISYIVRDILKYRHPTFIPNKFLWRYTFSQYNDFDCAYGYRPILRLVRSDAILYPDTIRELSKRQELGDSRAAGPRVPDNVWSIPRIVGNSWERVDFMPTQIPIRLMERIITFSLKADSAAIIDGGESMVDLMGGSGSAIKALFSENPTVKIGNYDVDCVELDTDTCVAMRNSIRKMFGVEVSIIDY